MSAPTASHEDSMRAQQQQQQQSAEGSGAGRPVLSRIAESLFWIGRYTERADGTARIVDVLRLQLLEDPGADEHVASRTVLSVIMGMPFEGEVGVRRRRRRARLRPLQRELDHRRAASPPARTPAAPARRCRPSCGRASTPRGTGGTASAAPSPPSGTCRGCASGPRSSSGIADSTMSHDEAWDFLVLGRSLERADMTARLVATGGLRGGAPWSVVLSSCGAQQAFMRSQRGLLSDDRAAAFLVLDREFPRSVFFALTEAERRLSTPWRRPRRSGSASPTRRAASWAGIRTSLEFRATSDVIADLPAQMLRVQGAVMAASHAIAKRYFQSGPLPTWTKDGVF